MFAQDAWLRARMRATAECASLARFEHPLEGHPRLPEDVRGYLDLVLHLQERVANILQRDLPHVRTHSGRNLVQELPRSLLREPVEHVRLCPYYELRLGRGDHVLDDA